MRIRKPPPQWWVDLDIPDRLRQKILADFTLTRDGYAIWYKGKGRTVCGKGTPPACVHAAWQAKRGDIDRKEGDAPASILSPANRTYRQTLSEFLAECEKRVKTRKPKPLAPRTLHNYTTLLNAFGKFIYDGAKVADLPLERANSPAVLSAYAASFGAWKASGWDSVVSRVGALFNWAVEMEYIDRFRPGPSFRRPAKQEIRDDRIDLSKSFTPTQFQKLWESAGATMRCWLALGVCAAFTNSDIGHVTRSVIDLEAGVIDFRRRKTGKVRRMIPLPADVVKLLKSYRRPEPADTTHADLFFISEYGHPYSGTRKGDGKPSDSISRLFRKLCKKAGVTTGEGQNFTGLRTTFFNLAPRHTHELEVKIIMGRAKGTIDLDHYLETLHLKRLREVVDSVWSQVSSPQGGEGLAPVAAVPSA